MAKGIVKTAVQKGLIKTAVATQYLDHLVAAPEADFNAFRSLVTDAPGQSTSLQKTASDNSGLTKAFFLEEPSTGDSLKDKLKTVWTHKRGRTIF